MLYDISFIKSYIMKLLIPKINKILDEKLTLTQRGILITILLLKDPDPKITLAKLRVKLKMSQIKEDLIKLHQEGYIEWSGYKQAKKSIAKKQATPAIIRIISYMNDLYKRKFDPHADKNITSLTNRLEKYSEEEIMNQVIENLIQ